MPVLLEIQSTKWGVATKPIGYPLSQPGVAGQKEATPKWTRLAPSPMVRPPPMSPYGNVQHTFYSFIFKLYGSMIGHRRSETYGACALFAGSAAAVLVWRTFPISVVTLHEANKIQINELQRWAQSAVACERRNRFPEILLCILKRYLRTLQATHEVSNNAGGRAINYIWIVQHLYRKITSKSCDTYHPQFSPIRWCVQSCQSDPGPSVIEVAMQWAW